MRQISEFSWFAGLQNRLISFGLAISKRSTLTRWILAGPVTIIASVLVMAGMALWIPAGDAKLNNIAIPIIILPIIWACCFFYSCIEENLPRAVLVMSAIIFSHLLLVTSAFT